MEDLAPYRQHIASAEQKAQEDFDKTVIALSGGGLGLSFAFIDKIIHGKVIVSPDLLYWAWSSWGASLLFVCVSYFCSIHALRRALRQSYTGSVYKDRPGGWWAVSTEALNVVGVLLFVVGLFLLLTFVRKNLG